ncbi:MAG: hypothetical protein K6G27_13180 [Lachnospiraceae bacterium]|nr:hypothetical protein [Lachnospiraceae bacterium]
MFTKQEFKKLDRKYFDVVLKTTYYIDLKSRNTGHTWSIYCKQLTMDRRELVVRHKHRDKDEYHIQPRFHPRNIDEAQKMIKDHDRWHLNGRRKTTMKG